MRAHQMLGRGSRRPFSSIARVGAFTPRSARQSRRWEDSLHLQIPLNGMRAEGWSVVRASNVGNRREVRTKKTSKTKGGDRDV